MGVLNPAEDISTYIQTIFEDAWFIAREESFMSRLVTNFSGDDEVQSRSSSQYSSVTIAQLNETDDLQSQAFTPSVVATLTPYEFGAQYFLPDRRLSADPFGLRADAACELGLGMAQSINTNLLSLLSSFTGGTVGAAGSTITWGYFFAMLSRLKAAKAPPPYYCVMHVYQWHQLAKASSVAASTQPVSSWLSDEVMRRWFVGSVAGVDILTTADISVNANDDAYCGMFSPVAMAIDMRRALRLEDERDASRRGIELNMTAVYAYGVWRPAMGITGLFDASTPTS